MRRVIKPYNAWLTSLRATTEETLKMTEETEQNETTDVAGHVEPVVIRDDKLLHLNVEELFASIRRSEQRRAEIMPDEQTALRVMFEAYTRLKELGFRDACYCPKDGSIFDAIEAGSTGIHDCSYDGEWPNGRWWAHDAGDLWPSKPILFRIKENV